MAEQQEEFVLNKIIYFNSSSINGVLKIKDSYVESLEIEAVSDYERLYIQIVPGSLIRANHEYKYVRPSFSDDYKNINFKQELEINEDIEAPEWFENKWLSTCTEKEFSKHPDECKRREEFLKDLLNNKISVETFREMLKDLIDNMTPTVNDDEVFDNGYKFVADVLQFIKKNVDKITEVEVDDLI